MKNSIIYNRDYYKTRFIAVFDLMGSTHNIKYREDLIFGAYSTAIENIEESEYRTIHASWFSDTFVFISDSNTFEDFVQINDMACSFFDYLLWNSYPVRGVINCGDIYFDEENNILYGEAYIEAYRLQDAQQIIGLSLYPDILSRTSMEIKKVIETHYYLTKIIPLKPVGKISTYTYFSGMDRNAIDVTIGLLEIMKDEAPAQAKQKYLNTSEMYTEIKSIGAKSDIQDNN